MDGQSFASVESMVLTSDSTAWWEGPQFGMRSLGLVELPGRFKPHPNIAGLVFLRPRRLKRGTRMLEYIELERMAAVWPGILKLPIVYQWAACVARLYQLERAAVLELRSMGIEVHIRPDGDSWAQADLDQVSGRAAVNNAILGIYRDQLAAASSAIEHLMGLDFETLQRTLFRCKRCSSDITERRLVYPAAVECVQCKEATKH